MARMRKAPDKAYLELIADVDFVTLQENVKVYFVDFLDPRENKRCVYPAWYLFLVLLCGYLSGCNTIADLAYYAEARYEWLNSVLGSNFDRVSYNTIWWFLARVKPNAFKALMAKCLGDLPQDLKEKLLIIDGKRLRGISKNTHVVHLVELFAAESGCVIAQEKVPDKRCERAALPALLGSIDVQGSLISIDAHYAYKEDLKLILQAGADYLVGIKGNQGCLEAEAHNYFEQAYAIQYEAEELKCYEEHDKGHGRIETRHVCVTQDLEWLPQAEEWGLKALIEVRSERYISGNIDKSTRYYGCSRVETAKQFGKHIRGHWGIENSLHYVADVVFEEDASLANTGYAAENIAALRRLAINSIKIADPNRGIADARRRAMYEPRYLRGVLSRIFGQKC